MTTIQPLDPQRVSLQGINLIEASAGTGKTWTISGLYLRLIIEQQLRVENILVVTFTEAATKELRDRIRAKLVDALQAFETGNCEDNLIAGLLASIPDHPGICERLMDAIHNFDQAAVFTINGFCQRLLSDYAFESSQPFNVEVITDQRDLAQEIVDDFWRKKIIPAESWLVEAVLNKNLSPDSLSELVGQYSGKSYLQLPSEKPLAVEPKLASYEQHFLRTQAIWQTDQADIQELIRTDKSLNGNKYRAASRIKWLAEMGLLFAGTIECVDVQKNMPLSLFDAFEKFTTATLQSSVKKGKEAPAHPFFDCCQQMWESNIALQTAIDSHITGLKTDLLNFLNQALESRKRERGLQSFDDQLNDVHKALIAEGGNQLGKNIRGIFKAALIDEFQDTDPVQYQIFQQIFGSGQQPVFFVGDPKQAIYSFRGADIFAYLNAQNDVDTRYTLDSNWRSSPKLIAATNYLFSQASNAFIYEQIQFQAVKAAVQDGKNLSVVGDSDAAFRFWYLPGQENNKPLSKTDATARATQLTTQEIVRLLRLGLSAEASIDDAPVSGGDIAVLVRTHAQGNQIAAALRQAGVPFVQQSQGSVFESEEASALERILLAIQQPMRTPLVRAALATKLLNYSATDLDDFSTDDLAWEARLSQFFDYHQIWRDEGFIKMFRRFLSTEQVPQKLLALVGGERRYTNVLHLMELLHQAASEQALGMETLVKWLGLQRQRSNHGDEQLMRLESDAQRVQIVTLHKSKGLEYPIVFCPYLWGDSSKIKSDRSLIFHDKKNQNCATLLWEAGSNGEAKEQAEEESQAENIRLLYVGLTRAKYRCYSLWGNISGASDSALGGLIEGTDRATLATLADSSNGAISLDQLPADDRTPFSGERVPTPELSVKVMARKLFSNWAVGSFSGLISGQHRDRPDRDEVQTRLDSAAVTATEANLLEVENDTAAAIFEFPRGAQAGTCLHHIYEHWDFSNSSRTALETQVDNSLRLYGFESEWVSVVADNMWHVLNAALPDMGGEKRPITLLNITPVQRLNEMEFHYPVHHLQGRAFQQLLEKHVPELAAKIGPVNFRSLKGYLHGFIDLIFESAGRFYIADYKSNHLGKTLQDYSAANMDEAMQQHQYYLQYLIYTLALHRYLRQCLPSYRYDSHFGGVYYLFLRGMRAQSSNGIYWDRPPEALIDALDLYFAGQAL